MILLAFHCLLFAILYLLFNVLIGISLDFVSGVKLKAPAEFGRSDHSAVMFEDNMFIYGGVSVNNTIPSGIQVFNFGK